MATQEISLLMEYSCVSVLSLLSSDTLNWNEPGKDFKTKVEAIDIQNNDIPNGLVQAVMTCYFCCFVTGWLKVEPLKMFLMMRKMKELFVFLFEKVKVMTLQLWQLWVVTSSGKDRTESIQIVSVWLGIGCTGMSVGS